MKNIGMIVGLVVLALLMVQGCSRSEKTPPAQVYNGVAVDIPKLNATFANASNEVKGNVTQVGFNIRYGKYEDALMALDKVVNDPAVTEDQKKVVNEVIEQVKKLANAAPAAAPAQ